MAIKINPDNEYVKEIKQKLSENNGYCPCKLEKTVDTLCMCKAFREQIKRGEAGYCHCGLWYIEGGGSPMQTQNIKIKYLNPESEKLSYVNGVSDWVDLRAATDITMNAFDFKLIPLGVAMQLPKGYEAHIIPRSSTYKTYGIIQANSMGLVDESYCGDNDQWYFPAVAMRDTTIHAGDRICQFRIMEHQPPIVFEEVANLGNKDRGGIGSTGVK